MTQKCTAFLADFSYRVAGEPGPPDAPGPAGRRENRQAENGTPESSQQRDAAPAAETACSGFLAVGSFLLSGNRTRSAHQQRIQMFRSISVYRGSRSVQQSTHHLLIDMSTKQRFDPYNGPPSRLHPNTYKGNEQSGGYLARNGKPASSNSPGFKGRLWLQGVGWFWLSAWSVQGKSGTYLSLRGNPMSDEDAERYCKPKQENSRPTHGDPFDPFTPPSRPQSGYDDSDIPF